MSKKITTATIRNMKKSEERITMLTAYDYTSASIVDESGVDMILVGDSLGMVVLGYEDTLSVTMEDMIRHTQAVSRGAKNALIVADMPFMSYQVTRELAIANAGRLVSEGKAEAVKLEGGREFLPETEGIIRAGIPVVGHLGLTPQSVNQFGGFKVQGKTTEAATKLIDDALVLEEAGVFAIVLECIPSQIAKLITEKLTIPTIGIGAGPHVDGQVLVFHDVVGLFKRFKPKFVKQYVDGAGVIQEGCMRYIDDVRCKRFPTEEYGFSIDEKELAKLESGDE
jgi:3-methyl-2-oxobutanoate hydroxymethyltransferase